MSVDTHELDKHISHINSLKPMGTPLSASQVNYIKSFIESAIQEARKEAYKTGYSAGNMAKNRPRHPYTRTVRTICEVCSSVQESVETVSLPNTPRKTEEES